MSVAVSAVASENRILCRLARSRELSRVAADVSVVRRWFTVHRLGW
jgi:hypothetical protein